jgi:hypothetical protein
MPGLKTYDLFISHAWGYHDDYSRMTNLLNNAPNFYWRNYSVPRDDKLDYTSSYALKEALKRQIRPVNAFILLGGVYASHSEWIDFEIDFALSISKPIVGVRKYGAERASSKLIEASSAVVNWSTSSIVDAVRNWSL